MKRYTIIRFTQYARPTRCFSTTQLSELSSSIATPKPTINKPKRSGIVSRIKGYSRYRKAQVIEARETRDLSILDKVLIMAKSLDKQTLITPLETHTIDYTNEEKLSTTDTTLVLKEETTIVSLQANYHPLWETSNEIKSVAKRSDPKNVLANIDTLLSHTIKKSSNTLPNQLLADSLFITGFKDLLQPSPSSSSSPSSVSTTEDPTVSINANNAQKSCQQFLRITLLREYLKRLKKVIDQSDIPLTFNAADTTTNTTTTSTTTTIASNNESNNNVVNNDINSDSTSKFVTVNNKSSSSSSSSSLPSYLSKIIATSSNASGNEITTSSGKTKKTLFTPDRVVQLCDSFLLGTSSERIAEHLHLYGYELSQYQLQESFYMLFESEVQSVTNLVELLSSSHQQLFKSQRPLESIIAKYDIKPSVNAWLRVNKRLAKYTRGYGYLLDVLEVNSKARCVFAWTDPNHSGFKALPDDHIFPVQEVLTSRQLYFKEADTVGASLIHSFTGSTRLLYEEEKENRSNFRYGVVFIILTIALDWIVCVV